MSELSGGPGRTPGEAHRRDNQVPVSFPSTGTATAAADEHLAQRLLDLPRATAGQPVDGSGDRFGDEFRELARVRRFIQSGGARDGAVDSSRPAVQQPLRAQQTPLASQPATPRPTRPAQTAPSAVPVAAAPVVTMHDVLAAIGEVARMGEQLAEVRERYAVERARADRAERDAQSLRDRLLAARALVHEAQRTAHATAERAAYLQGRVESLEDGLDRALRSSALKRWRWRRSMRRRPH